MVLQRIPRPGGHLRSPQCIDQRIHRHQAAGLEREEREQRLLLRAGHRHAAALRNGFERSEQPDLQRMRHRARRSRTIPARARPCQQRGRGGAPTLNVTAQRGPASRRGRTALTRTAAGPPRLHPRRPGDDDSRVAAAWRCPRAPAQEACSFSFSLLRAIVHARLELGLAPLAQRAACVLRGRVGGLLGSLDLIDHGGDGAPRDLASELLHLAVEHLDGRLDHARDHRGRPRRDRPGERRHGIVRRLRAVHVGQPAHEGAGAHAEQDAERSADDAEQHADHRSARRAREPDVVRALRQMQLPVRGALDDGRRLEPDAAIGRAVLDDAERLVGLARLREPNDDHVVDLVHGVLLLVGTVWTDRSSPPSLPSRSHEAGHRCQTADVRCRRRAGRPPAARLTARHA